MKTIYKYQLGHTTTLELPKGAKLLTIQEQGEDLMAWFEVDKDEKAIDIRKFVHVPTGFRFNETLEEGKYVTTYQRPPFVWHIYEI